MKKFLSVALMALLFVGCSSDDSNDDGMTVGDCNQPTQFSEFIITQTSATVSWNQEGAASFVIEYGAQGFALGSGSQVTSTNLEAEITGLEFDTTYSYYIRAICSSNNVSEFIGPESFTTLACEKVTDVVIFDIFENAASVQFNADGFSDVEIEYGPTGFTLGTGTIIIGQSGISSQIDGLTAGTTYDVYIRTICGDTFSEYSDVAMFTTLPACTAPSEVDGVPLGSGAVGLGWDPTGESAWRVEYGLTGFSLGNGAEINTSSNSIKITGLQSGEVYDFYVQANCGADGFSDFTGPLTLVVQ